MNKNYIEVVPAILAKTKEEFEKKLIAVPSANIIQIDIMDGRFVDNKTVSFDQISSLLPLQKEIEYHLMVQDPYLWIEAIPPRKKNIFQIHVEAVSPQEIDEIIDLVEKKSAKLCFALNPDTPIEILNKLPDINHVLLMTVHPGKSGQQYIKEVENKISKLRKLKPDCIIEIDGGANESTSLSAIAAGANRIAMASAIFNSPNPDKQYIKFKNLFNQR